jgi:glutamyl-tRNA synthetase
VDDERVVSFTDLCAGSVSQQVQQAVGDFILRRADGIFAYQFAVVVDDGLMRIDQVVRGCDLLSSTARQILLFEALNFPVPVFVHVPLWLDSSGQRLSKRLESTGLAPLQSGGAAPAQVVGQLAASCGLVEPGEHLSAAQLVERYRGKQHDIIRSILSS